MVKSATRRTPKKRIGAQHRDWKPRFLAALIQSPNIAGAAKAAGIVRTSAYAARAADPAFAAAWEDALAQAIDTAEGELFRRAVTGTQKPITVAGKREVITEHSDVLLIFLLKSHRRSIYGERVTQEISGPDGGPIAIIPVREVFIEHPGNGVEHPALESE